MWRVLSGLVDFPHRTRRRTATTARPPADVLDLLNRTVITLAAFGGLAAESMTRGQGWRFLDMGRQLERSLHTIALLRGHAGHARPRTKARCWKRCWRSPTAP